jgi:hypothetical protein
VVAAPGGCRWTQQLHPEPCPEDTVRPRRIRPRGPSGFATLLGVDRVEVEAELDAAADELVTLLLR